MKIETQKEHFESLWSKNTAVFGTRKWDPTADFSYFIEIPISTNLVPEMEEITDNLKSIGHFSDGIWVEPNHMHITLALPGRQGHHFQGNDTSFMKRELQKIWEKTEPFSVALGNINFFPDGIFREVYDPTEKLHQLHKKICEKIPFSQHPQYQFDHFLPHMSLYYGSGSTKLIQHPSFQRVVGETQMNIERLFLGEITNDNGVFDKRILKEYTFETNTN